jgi:hypothetical protein
MGSKCGSVGTTQNDAGFLRKKETQNNVSVEDRGREGYSRLEGQAGRTYLQGSCVKAFLK